MEVKTSFVNMAQELQKIFARRLGQARAMRGWSLRRLQEALGDAVSHNALSKYEKGEMMPRSQVLLALAQTLEQPVDFFFRPFRWKSGSIRFRKKSKFPAARQKAVQEKAADFVERYREAEELTGDVRNFHSPFTTENPVRSPADAEEFAERLRKEWNLGDDPLPSVLGLMEARGIKVLELEKELDSFDGLYAQTDAGPVVVLGAQTRRNVPRKRMTAAHELGHIVLPFASEIEERAEEQAVKAFAGAFLLPERTFKETFGKQRQRWTVAELKEIKRQFGVSIMGIMKRAESLNLISSATYKHFCIRTRQWGWHLKGEPGDDVWTQSEESTRFPQLVRRAMAEERISTSKGAALLGVPLSRVRDAEMHQIIE